jgi:hypothetical protein
MEEGGKPFVKEASRNKKFAEKYFWHHGLPYLFRQKVCLKSDSKKQISLVQGQKFPLKCFWLMGFQRILTYSWKFHVPSTS